MTYLQPALPILLIIIGVGLFLCWWRPGNRRAIRLAVLGLAGVFLFSWPPAAWVALGTLEWRYPRHAAPEGEAQAIVVLASYVLPATALRPYPVVAEDTYLRCLHAAWLHEHWQPLPVLASGGGPHGNSGPSFASTMGEVLRQQGVPSTMIWTEDRSESTHEAAVYAVEILRSKGIQRIALVTEAYHMPRAEGSFRRAGIEVIAAPCRFHSAQLSWAELLPGPEAINQNGSVLHEWVGMLWYRARGWV